MTATADIVLGSPENNIWSWPRRAFYFLRRWPVIPLVIIAVLAVIAIGAPVLAPHNPQSQDLTKALVPPMWVNGGSSSHPFGTDEVGRDVLSRIMYGSRISLMVAMIAMVAGMILGTLTGMVAGYFGGVVDEVLMRLVDLWLSLPFILLALVVAVIVGASLSTVIWLLAVSSWSAGARNIRGEVLSIRTRDYVALAQVSGASHWRILTKHIFPQITHVLIVITTLRSGHLIIAEAGLSFLGVGVPASIPTWGNMVSEGDQYLTVAWWVSIIPGMAIFLTVIAFNFFGDWVRDRLDPRLRQLD